MIYELGLSKKHFGLPQEVIDLYISYLEKLDFKKSYEFENSIDYLLEILKDDKKSKSDSVDIVLLSDISQPNLISISFDELIEVITKIKNIYVINGPNLKFFRYKRNYTIRLHKFWWVKKFSKFWS